MSAAHKMEDGYEKRQSNGGSRWLYFFLGVFMAASIGLAIALIVKEVKDDDDQKVVVVTQPTSSAAGTESHVPMTTSKPHVATTTAPRKPDEGSGNDAKMCTSAACVLRAGELLAAMDRKVDPCTDFYQYSCGNWIRTHSIPESDSSYSRFGELRDTVTLELKGLLEKPYDSSKESSSIAKAKNLYQSCLDEETLAKRGVAPLKKLIDDLGTWPLTSPGQPRPALDLESTVVKMSRVQVAPLLDIGVYQDNKNSSLYLTWITQPGFGIDRDYMVKGRNSSEVSAYEELLVQLAVHVLGLDESAALRKDIGDVVEMEVTLAKGNSSYGRSLMRKERHQDVKVMDADDAQKAMHDPFFNHLNQISKTHYEMSASRTDMRDETKYYKKMTVSDLKKEVPAINWMKLLTEYFKPVSDNVTVTENMQLALYAKDYLNGMMDYYNNLTDKRVVENCILMRTVIGYFGYLSKDIRDLNLNLRKVLYGVTQKGARWKSCVRRVDSNMPTAEGQLYVSTYFPNTAKEKALEMINYIRQSMAQVISDVEWMDSATKAKALDKLHAIYQKIGYPDYQFNETMLEELYKDADYKPDDYFNNMLSFIRNSVKDNSLNLLRVPSKKVWSSSASTVNAFYNPGDNTITFPAGILQPPFYSADFPMAMTFGGIGMVIGHEITHGFDDQGRKYDKNGNNVAWWSNSSVVEYEKLTQCYVDQYSESVVAGMHVNGRLTLGENIADNGGLKSSFLAFEKWQQENGRQPILPGLELSNEQLFFVNFAQGWCNLITEEGAKNRLLTDPHSPANVRILVPSRNSQQFADAFKCPVGSPMNPAKKCQLW